MVQLGRPVGSRTRESRAAGMPMAGRNEIMTVQKDDHERTMAFAEIAFGQIKALRQPASPRHFEIWYAYATGYRPSCNQAMNETLQREGTLTEANINRTDETYNSPTPYCDRIEDVGAQV